jgi:hypothetical protein
VVTGDGEVLSTTMPRGKGENLVLVGQNQQVVMVARPEGERLLEEAAARAMGEAEEAGVQEAKGEAAARVMGAAEAVEPAVAQAGAEEAVARAMGEVEVLEPAVARAVVEGAAARAVVEGAAARVAAAVRARLSIALSRIHANPLEISAPYAVTKEATPCK